MDNVKTTNRVRDRILGWLAGTCAAGVVLCIVMFIATTAYSQCDPPPETRKTNNFGFGITNVAIMWDATNTCPNTWWFREYSMDGGNFWQRPNPLGTSNGVWDPTNKVFVGWRKHYFFVPSGVTVITRAIPQTPF